MFVRSASQIGPYTKRQENLRLASKKDALVNLEMFHGGNHLKPGLLADRQGAAPSQPLATSPWSIGKLNGLFRRPRTPTSYCALWPSSCWCWGLPARPAPHARAGRAQGVPAAPCATGSHPHRTGTREASRWPAPQGTDSTGAWGRGACAAGAAAARRAAGPKRELNVECSAGVTSVEGRASSVKGRCNTAQLHVRVRLTPWQPIVERDTLTSPYSARQFSTLPPGRLLLCIELWYTCFLRSSSEPGSLTIRAVIGSRSRQEE